MRDKKIETTVIYAGNPYEDNFIIKGTKEQISNIRGLKDVFVNQIARRYEGWFFDNYTNMLNYNDVTSIVVKNIREEYGNETASDILYVYNNSICGNETKKNGITRHDANTIMKREFDKYKLNKYTVIELSKGF